MTIKKTWENKKIPKSCDADLGIYIYIEPIEIGIYSKPTSIVTLTSAKVGKDMQITKSF